MKLAIAGSRYFNNYDLLLKYMGLFLFENIEEIISGGAAGADSLGERYAIYYHIPVKRFLAEWSKYGKSAGFIRNQLIVDNCDMLLVFWDGKSAGTADTIAKAKKAKKPTFIIYFDVPKPEIKKPMKGL
jgi:hypothetical protein